MSLGAASDSGANTAPQPPDSSTPPPRSMTQAGAPGTGKHPQTIPQSAEVMALARGNNHFACDLYAQLRNEKGNLFFSPFSISTILAMTAAGARGETQASMVKALRPPFHDARWHEAGGALLAHLEAVQQTNGVKLSIANSLWPNLDFQPTETFLAIAEKKYRAKVTPLDYGNDEPSARATINNWVLQGTGGKITNILANPLSRDTRLILINAIHFKGDWAVPFRASQTRTEPFHLANGQSTPTPFMHLRERIFHARIGETGKSTPNTPADAGTSPPAPVPAAALVKLPYSGRNLSMLVLLPEENTPAALSALENALSAENLEAWHTQARQQEVILAFPKFKIESGTMLLARPLASLGMGSAFTPAADFHGISAKEGLFIGDALHKAFVEVNETGTEAAAATVVGIRATSIGAKPLKPVEFRADHPFLFLIMDDATRSILFIGRFSTPPQHRD